MGNMSDEMKKVMAKWGADEQPEVTPAKPQESSAPRTTYRNLIYQTIKDNPGITSLGVLQSLTDRNIPQAYNSVSSQITGLHQEFMLRRESGRPTDGGRPLYQYYAVPPLEAMKLKAEHARKKQLAQARAERARQAKALKVEAKQHAQKMLQEQLALPLMPPVPEPRPVETVAPVPAPQAAPNLRDMSAMDILNAINFAQAKELYKELKEAFGG